MIKNWQSHQEYLNFLHEAKIHFDSSQRARLAGECAAAREKLRLLNLDSVMELLEAYYPPLGRPAINQPQILRPPCPYAGSGLYRHYRLGGKAKLRLPAGSFNWLHPALPAAAWLLL